MKFWKRKPKRTSWIWCPQCRHDLNGDDRSFTGYDTDGLAQYKCAACGFRSVFLLDAPVPIWVP